jgi:hypothetical protein
MKILSVLKLISMITWIKKAFAAIQTLWNLPEMEERLRILEALRTRDVEQKLQALKSINPRDFQEYYHLGGKQNGGAPITEVWIEDQWLWHSRESMMIISRQ